jgi:hypothetical protein
MTGPRRRVVARIDVVLVAATTVATFAFTVSAVSAAATVAGLSGNAQPKVASPVPADVVVVAQGAPVGADVAVLVANGTDQPVRDVRLDATATRADGTVSTRARSVVVVPSVIAPGAFAVARVGFGKAPLAPDDKVTVGVRTSRRGGAAAGPLSVSQTTLSGPQSGPVAQQLAVTLANGSTRAVRARGTLGVMCFGEAQNPVLTVTARVPKKKIAAGGTTTTTVDLPALCPSYLVGLSDKT